ncbi:hypothetical protein GCM10027076_03720 [Nocardioides montaniterrae]
MSDEHYAAAVKTVIAAALADLTAGPVVAYDYDEIPGTSRGDKPGTRPARYVAIDLSRRYSDNRRASGEVSFPLGRLGTRYCAESVTSLREIRRRVRAALESQILPGDFGPFDFEIESEELHADALGYTAVDDWTF